MGFRLRIAEGRGAGKEFRFSQPIVRIGRLPDNDLVLYDMGVSRHHCEILTDGDTNTLRDTGSANGTLLNEAMTTEAQIRVGDKIQVGPVVFLFEALVPKEEGARVPLPSRKEMFRPQSESRRRILEEQATSAVSRDVFHGRRRSAEPFADEEGRKGSASFVSYAGLRRRLVPRSTRLAILLGLLVIGAGGTLFALILEGRSRPDRSAELFAIDSTNAALSFGAGKVDIFTPDRVNFQFDYDGGRVTALYTAGGIELATELEILLNGKSVGHVSTSPGRWATGLKTVLPRRLLEPGTNVLTFDNTLTPETRERWGVAQVQILQEELPPPDEKKAEELLDLGKAAYDTRSVAPQNMWRAVQYFREARLYLEGFDSPPPLLTEVDEAEKRASEELQATFDAYMFAAEKATRFGEQEEAVASLREALRHFPDADDKRHEAIKRRLSNLAGRR